MKHFLLSLLFVLYSTVTMFSQEVLKEFIIEKGSPPLVSEIFKEYGCNPDDGVIVFNTTIPDLEFTIPDAPNRLKHVSSFDTTNKRYVLCVQPTDGIGGYTKYAILVNGKIYKPEAQPVSAIKPGVAQYFKINPKKEFQPRQWYVALGGGSNLIGDVAFPCGGFELGYYINSKNRLSVEFDFGSYTEKELEKFSYTVTTNPSGSQEHYNDGKINYDYMSVLFLVSWSYIVDLTGKFQWRIGPSIGSLSISGADSYTPTEVRGVRIEGLPEPQSVSQGAFVYGVNTGITWNFSKNKRWFLDLGYRLYGNTGISFEKRYLNILGSNVIIEEKDFSDMGNQIKLTLGWRFGNVK